jgi:hypothetical protein
MQATDKVPEDKAPRSAAYFENGRLVAMCLLAGSILFMLAMGVSMACYPGGHGWSPAAAGYDFWRNFWCDLLAPITRAGDRNNFYSMLFAMLGTLAFAIGSIPLWYCFKQLIPGSPRLGMIIRVCGLAAVFGIVPVTLTAGQSLPHALSILFTALSGWLAALLAVFALARHYPGRMVTRVGWAMILMTATNFLLYVRERFLDGSMWVALPTTQKIATLVMILWFLNMAWLFMQPLPVSRGGSTGSS